MSRHAQRTIAAGFLLLIWLPLIVMGTGVVKPKPIENRPLTALPRLSGRSLLQRRTFDGLNSYLTDRLPRRDIAIKKREQLSVKLFRESAADQVVIGNDGWLYLGQVVRLPCYTKQQMEGVRNALAELTSLLREADKTLHFLVPPAKETVYPEHLQGRDRRTSCVAQNSARLRAAMRGADPGYSPRLVAATRTNKTLYFPKDTHWDWRGAAIGTQDLIDSIQPGLFDQRAYTLHPLGGSQLYDLTALEGLPESGRADTGTVNRPGIRITRTQQDTRGPGISAFRQKRTGGPLIKGRTVVIHDSFGELLRPLASPWFADVEWYRLPESIDTGRLAGAMRDGQNIVIELTERMAAFALEELVAAAKQATVR